MAIHLFEIILYVQDQTRSTRFYSELLAKAPLLEVPGMTEFDIAEGVKLGLMTEAGIARIITPALPHPSSANGAPRCELYLQSSDLESQLELAVRAGAKLIDPLTSRDWGDDVVYLACPDNHVIALARPSKSVSPAPAR